MQRKEDALAFYTAALKKVINREALIKYLLYGAIGVCHDELGRDVEATENYSRAYSGLETHLGKRHKGTLILLYQRVYLHSRLREPDAVLKLCDTVFQGQDTVLELKTSFTYVLQCLRRSQQDDLGNLDEIARLDEALRDTLAQCWNLQVMDMLIFEVHMPMFGPMSGLLQFAKIALEFVWFVIAVLRQSQSQGNVGVRLYPEARVQRFDQRLRDSTKAQKLTYDLWELLWQHRESRIADLLKSEKMINVIFLTFSYIGLYDDTLQIFSIVAKELGASEGPDHFHTLQAETYYVVSYVYLHRETEVEEFSRDLYARQINVLGPNHQYTRLARAVLDVIDGMNWSPPRIHPVAISDSEPDLMTGTGKNDTSDKSAVSTAAPSAQTS